MTAFGFNWNASPAQNLGYGREISGALKASGKAAGVLCLYENHSQDSRVTGPKEVCPTVSQQRGTGGNNTPLVIATGQAGAEIEEDLSPTLNCDHEQPIIFSIDPQGTPPVATAVDCRNAVENNAVNGTLQAHDGGGISYNCNNVIRTGTIIRRLIPLECEWLQGFPDGWTNIGPWTDSKGKRHRESSDSARYTALGNSIALPFWLWLTKRMAKYLPDSATLGSLFDGIGGFPLCWETVHGKGTARWASEIEEFPIAVTRKRFGEGKEENAHWLT